MVPGYHYNFVKEEGRFITEEAGLLLFQKQMVTGDATDNIPGVPGCGKVAGELLNDIPVDARWAHIHALYVQAYGFGEDAEDAMLENGRLLWMRLEPNQWWQLPDEIKELSI